MDKKDMDLRNLSKEQQEAVNCISGPVLIVAGAGSGKTRVLTMRIANIIESGVDASRILALTFTKKAAGEMKERIAGVVGSRQASRIYMGTFHSVFIRFLREYADRIGYPSSFTVHDNSDSVSAIKNCIKRLGLDEKTYKPKDVLARISMAKNNLVLPNAYRNDNAAMENDRHSRRPEIVNIYAEYQKAMKGSGVMDFDDILLNMNILLRDHPEACEELSSRFSHILVDEYQDTNFAQYLIIKKLGYGHRNVCVVGDDSQSIYAFRGARIQNILNFEKDYPDRKIFCLEANYRSTKMIVDAANSIIAKNSNRIPKTCHSVGEVGEKILLINAYSEREEASSIADSIVSRIRSDSAKYNDFAILYRKNSQSRALEEALRARNIPYMVYSGHSFYDRAEVKDMIAYMKLAVNPSDDESFRRVVNTPARGIGNTTLAALDAAAKANSLPLFKACSLENILEYGVKDAARKKLLAFCDMLTKLGETAKTGDAVEVAKRIGDDSGIYLLYKSDNSVEGQAKAANIEEVINSVGVFKQQRIEEYEMSLDDAAEGDGAGGEGAIEAAGANGANEGATGVGVAGAEGEPTVLIADYLENIALLSNADSTVGDDENNKVALMTVHSSKGLEFPYVYIAGMEENMFPSTMMFSSPAEIEEERRLFYVAVTRAEKAVTLTFAKSRMSNGQPVSNRPSRFLREIDPKYILNPLSRDDYSESNSSFGGSGIFGSRSGGFGGRSGAYGGGWSNSSAYGGGRTGSSGSGSYGGGRSDSGSYGSGRNSVWNTNSITSRPLPDKIPDSEFTPMDMREVKAGMRIEHNRFGLGTVNTVVGEFPEIKATIRFDRYGEKLLLLKYAKLRIPK